MVFLDLKSPFGSVDWTALFSAFHRNDIQEKFVNLLQTLFSHACVRIWPYGVYQVHSKSPMGCPTRVPFLFSFFIDEVMMDGLVFQDIGFELTTMESFSLDYVDGIVSEFAEHV